MRYASVLSFYFFFVITCSIKVSLFISPYTYAICEYAIGRANAMCGMRIRYGPRDGICDMRKRNGPRECDMRIGYARAICECLCAQPVYGRWCAHSIVNLHPVKQRHRRVQTVLENWSKAHLETILF